MRGMPRVLSFFFFYCFPRKYTHIDVYTLAAAVPKIRADMHMKMVSAGARFFSLQSGVTAIVSGGNEKVSELMWVPAALWPFPVPMIIALDMIKK